MPSDHGMSPIHRLNFLKGQGSSKHDPQQPGAKARSWEDLLNIDRAFSESRTVRGEDTELNKHAARNHREREQHRDDVATQSSKFTDEVKRTVVDQQLLKFAAQFLRNHEATEMFGTVAALEEFTYFVNATLNRIGKRSVHQEVLDITQPEILFVLEKAASKVRTISSGPKYNPSWTDAQEFFL